MPAQPTLEVSLGVSPYGTPEPQITLRVKGAASARVVRAELHRLAAEVELATSLKERWVVQWEPGGDASGRVYLDLVHANQAETERGLAVLEGVARDYQPVCAVTSNGLDSLANQSVSVRRKVTI